MPRLSRPARPRSTRARAPRLRARRRERRADQARCEVACDCPRSGDRRAGPRLAPSSSTRAARPWSGSRRRSRAAISATELRLDPTRYAAPVERALADCIDAPAATIFFGPDVLAALDATLPEWHERWSGKQAIEFAADPGLAAGGFRIETPTRSLDAGLEGLTARLREGLAAAFEAPASVSDAEGAAC